MVPLFDAGIKWYETNVNPVVIEDIADINKVNGTMGGVVVNNSFSANIKSAKSRQIVISMYKN